MKLLLATMALLLPGLAQGAADSPVRAALEQAARRALPDSVVEIELHGLSTRGKVELPEGAELRVRVAGDEDWLGRISAEIDVSVSGELLGTLTALAEVAAYIEVPVTRGGVSRGAVLSPSDIALAKRDAGTLPRGVLLDPAALVGRTLKRDLELNQLLRESDLEERLDARRNQPVMLVLSSGSLRVTAPGLLKRDARLGDLVEVVSIATKTTVYGLLIAPDTVELVGASSLASSAQWRTQ